jgi:hypothetical protein
MSNDKPKVVQINIQALRELKEIHGPQVVDIQLEAFNDFVREALDCHEKAVPRDQVLANIKYNRQSAVGIYDAPGSGHTA